MARPTKGEIREVLAAMKGTIRDVENAVTEDSGDKAAGLLETLDEQLLMAFDLTADRYPDSFEEEVEVGEGEHAGEAGEEEPEEPEEEAPN
jgi:hypothetical protein